MTTPQATASSLCRKRAASATISPLGHFVWVRQDNNVVDECRSTCKEHGATTGSTRRDAVVPNDNGSLEYMDGISRKRQKLAESSPNDYRKKYNSTRRATTHGYSTRAPKKLQNRDNDYESDAGFYSLKEPSSGNTDDEEDFYSCCSSFDNETTTPIIPTQHSKRDQVLENPNKHKQEYEKVRPPLVTATVLENRGTKPYWASNSAHPPSWTTNKDNNACQAKENTEKQRKEATEQQRQQPFSSDTRRAKYPNKQQPHCNGERQQQAVTVTVRKTHGTTPCWEIISTPPPSRTINKRSSGNKAKDKSEKHKSRKDAKEKREPPLSSGKTTGKKERAANNSKHKSDGGKKRAKMAIAVRRRNLPEKSKKTLSAKMSSKRRTKAVDNVTFPPRWNEYRLNLVRRATLNLL